jgi:hypothetical protein
MNRSAGTGAACATIVIAALVLYWPATSAWFFQDDLSWLAGSLTFRPVDLLNFSAQDHFFRPVISLYFWVATPLFAGSPVLFHWANNALHAANGLLVFVAARAIGFDRRWSFWAALFFVSIPAYIEAITWVSALAEPVTTFFGLIALFALLHARRQRSSVWKTLSVCAFAMALITHESAVVLLPLLMIADWAFPPDGERRTGLLSDVATKFRRFLPYALPLAVYLAADLAVNSKNYLVEEGHYRLGLHAVGNLLAYVVTLYAGGRRVWSLALAAIVLTLLLILGTPRVRFATCWILLSLLPFSFFTWSNTSRYSYMPAVGIAWLVSDALQWLDRRLVERAGVRMATMVTTLLAAFIAVRFMLFASKNIAHFAERTEPYRECAERLRRNHPNPPSGARLPVDVETADRLQFRYAEALAQWEFSDPSLTLEVRP